MHFNNQLNNLEGRRIICKIIVLQFKLKDILYTMYKNKKMFDACIG